MKKLLVFLLVFVLSIQLYSKQVELDRAQKVAANFLAQTNGLKSISIDELIPVPLKLPGEDRFQHFKSVKVEDSQLVYLFKRPFEGFVLVSGDDRAKPILGYSTTGGINEEDLPVNMLKWVESYKKQIRFIKKDALLKSEEADSEWSLLETGAKLPIVVPGVVNPLISTTWSQAPYYNDLCPQEHWFSNKAVTGCVATAMAQIMKYHNYPKQGTGIHTYYHTSNTVTYGNLSANFGATTYDWSNMPDALSAGSSTAQLNAVATLMFHCGVGVNMNYSPQTSGAWVTEEFSREETCAEYAFKEFFAYDKSSIRGITREGKTNAEWMKTLNAELDAGRPIMFAGVGDGGGHAFVADGYDSNNYYHINWGWGGNSDGYYSVDAFNPVDLGTGAGNGSYNWDQRIVAGIKPPTQIGDGDIRLYDDITVPEIYQFLEFRIDLSIANYGTNDLVGELGAALFNDQGDFIEFIEIFDIGEALTSGYYLEVWFDSDGLSVYPGNYLIGVYYKPVGENWIAIGDGDYQNFIPIEILSPFGDTDIKLYDSIKIAPNPLIVGQSMEINTQMANFGNTDYKGQLGAGLFHLDGEIAQELEVLTDITMEAQNLYSVWFDNASIDVEPGAYLLGLVHFPEGEDDQYVVGPAEFINPIEVNVTLAPFGPDSFENNDDVSNAYGFLVDYQNDYAGLYTEQTSIHSTNDVDYYKIAFPEGYNYVVLPRVHDSYSFDPEIGNDFTCDVIWAHSNEGDWSELYDDEMDEPFIVYNGGVVYFGILPYFEGQTGSYSFSIEILRELSTGVKMDLAPDLLRIYPNPVKQQLFVKSPFEIIKYELFDSKGKQKQTDAIHQSQFSIDVSNYPMGLYFLKLHNEHEIVTQKIMINE